MFSQRTTTALLHGLRDPGNSKAWDELDGRCRPIMLAVCRRMGLTHEESEDAVQAAMVSFVEAYRHDRYERDRGRLSAFIITILRHRAIDRLRQDRQRHEALSCVDSIEALSESEIERYWLDERENQILRQALDMLREDGTDERMLAAFDLYGLRGIEVSEVSARLDMTREEIYNAKYRITKRLQPIVARLDELYEDV